MYYELKPSIRILYNKEKKIVRMGGTEPLACEFEIEDDKFLDVLTYFDGNHSVEDIGNILKIEQKLINEIVRYLLDNQLLEKKTQEVDLFYDRFNNYLKISPPFLDKNSVEILEILNRKKVAIIGCGAIGCNVLRQLVAGGIKEFVLYDDDKIEVSNIGRQILYDMDDIGKLKVEVCKEKISKLNKNVNFKVVNEKINKFNFGNILDCDLLVLSADTPANIGELINKICIDNNIPFIKAGMYESYALLGPLVQPFKTACFECLLSKSKTFIDKEEIYSQINKYPYLWKQGLHPSLIMLSASIVSSEIIKILTLGKSKFLNHTAIVDMNNLNFYWSEFQKNEQCLVCGVNHDL